MSDSKSSMSNAKSYEEMGEYWDRHDLADHWEETKPAQFDVNVKSLRIYFAVEPSLSERLRANAARKGITAETLLNLWLQERITQETSS